jgi:hypothetical protein
LGAIWSKPPGNHEVTLFNRGKSNPDLFPQFRNDPWPSGYLQRPGHDDVLVMAIRCSRVFTGQQFSNGRATAPLDRGIGVETGHIELDESWQVTEYPTATVLPGSPSEEALNLLAGWTAAQLSIQTA